MNTLNLFFFKSQLKKAWIRLSYCYFHNKIIIFLFYNQPSMKSIFVSCAQKNRIFIAMVKCTRERLFSEIFFFFLENNPKKISLIFRLGFLLTKDNFLLTNFFYTTKYWKLWKTIFTKSFLLKQTECYTKLEVNFVLFCCLLSIILLKFISLRMAFY